MEMLSVMDLQSYLEQADLVILIDIENVDFLTKKLCESEALEKTDKQVVVIGTEDFPQKSGRHIYRTVSEREMEELLKIYRSYEASDRLLLLSDGANYGSMWNYVRNGIITEQEMFDAIFA